MNTIHTVTARKQYPLLPAKSPIETSIFLVTLPILVIVSLILIDKHHEGVIWVLLLSLPFCLWFSFSNLSHSIRHRKLDSVGLLVEGVIIDKWDEEDQDHPKTTYVAYQFNYRNTVWTGKHELDSFLCLMVGNSINIRFLPDTPSISRLELDNLY